MTRISSSMTRFYKYVFPVLWFAVIVLFVVTSISVGALRTAPFVLLPPLVFVVFGWLMFRRLIWDLADDVEDDGDALLVRYRGYRERIPLSNIMNVSVSTAMNPPRITLRFVERTTFGTELAFSPVRPFSLNPFAKNPVAEDLIVRVHAARQRRA